MVEWSMAVACKVIYRGFESLYVLKKNAEDSSNGESMNIFFQYFLFLRKYTANYINEWISGIQGYRFESYSSGNNCSSNLRYDLATEKDLYLWRCGREAECGGLLSRWTFIGSVGSNPTASAQLYLNRYKM